MVCSIEITEDSNITSSNYKESITNMVNKVRIYDGEGKPQGVVQNDADVKSTVYSSRLTLKRRARMLLPQLRVCLRRLRKPLLWNV